MTKHNTKGAAKSTARHDDFLNGWLRSEAARRDSINVKRVYIDLCGGNLIDAVLFSQIMYWHEPKPDGQPRLTIERNGHRWLARRYEDWWDDCRVPERAARDGIARLVAVGLLIKQRWHFDGKPTVHLRVNPARFAEFVAAAENGTLDALRARLLSDASRHIVTDAPRQIDAASIRRQPSDGSDAPRQIAPPANRRQASDTYTEITENLDDDVEAEFHHHQDVSVGAPPRDVPRLLRERYRQLALPESIWRQWRHHSDEHQLACILHAQGEGSNPPGLLRSMLDGDGLPLPKYAEHARRLLDQSLAPPVAPAQLRAPRAMPRRLAASDGAGLDQRPGESALTLRDVWRSVVGQLQMQLNRNTFASYVQGTEAIRYAEGALVVRPRHLYAAQWFESAAAMLDAVASQIAGAPIQVRCERPEPAAVATQGETA